MYGAIIGDIAGSNYEFSRIKTKDFPLFPAGCDYTDDSIMTLAVAKALLRSREEQTAFSHTVVEEMQRLGRAYPYPKGAYGMRFSRWLDDPHPMPYNSFGNGSAMRVSPCGLIAVTLEEALDLAEVSAEVTHNHPEGIKGAQAVAAAIFLARTETKEEIRRYIHENFYPMDRTLEQIRPDYRFDESCQKTVPEAIIAFLESENFEDAIRNAISLGGDADTIGAITGSIAWTYYRGKDYESYPDDMIRMRDVAEGMLPEDFRKLADEFDKVCMHRRGTYGRCGACSAIPL